MSWFIEALHVINKKITRKINNIGEKIRQIHSLWTMLKTFSEAMKSRFKLRPMSQDDSNGINVVNAGGSSASTLCQSISPKFSLIRSRIIFSMEGTMRISLLLSHSRQVPFFQDLKDHLLSSTLWEGNCKSSDQQLCGETVKANGFTLVQCIVGQSDFSSVQICFIYKRQKFSE